jgi:hypothetical protein
MSFIFSQNPSSVLLLSLFFPLCLSLSFFVFLCLSVSFFVFLCLSVSFFVFLCLSVSFFVFLCLSVSFCVFLFFLFFLFFLNLTLVSTTANGFIHIMNYSMHLVITTTNGFVHIMNNCSMNKKSLLIRHAFAFHSSLLRQTTQLKYLSTGVIWSHLQFYSPDWESCSNSCGSQVDQFPGGENFATRRN